MWVLEIHPKSPPYQVWWSLDFERHVRRKARKACHLANSAQLGLKKAFFLFKTAFKLLWNFFENFAVKGCSIVTTPVNTI